MTVSIQSLNQFANKYSNGLIEVRDNSDYVLLKAIILANLCRLVQVDDDVIAQNIINELQVQYIHKISAAQKTYHQKNSLIYDYKSPLNTTDLEKMLVNNGLNPYGLNVFRTLLRNLHPIELVDLPQLIKSFGSTVVEQKRNLFCSFIMFNHMKRTTDELLEVSDL